MSFANILRSQDKEISSSKFDIICRKLLSVKPLLLNNGVYVRTIAFDDELKEIDWLDKNKISDELQLWSKNNKFIKINIEYGDGEYGPTGPYGIRFYYTPD